MGTITIVGLGPGAVGHLSLETMGLLQNCAQVILRTAVHPTVAELEKQNVQFTSCDDLYEKAASFEEVYDSVVERVLAAAQNGDVVYAVPGSPLVAEKTVVLMRTAAKAQGVKLVIKPSMSFLDLAYVELGIDPIAGLQIIDAQDFAEIASAGQHPLMITQVYSQMVAGKDAPTFGEAKNSWLTGTAAWTFFNVSQYILGIQPTLDGLKVDPCIPHTLGGFTVTRRYRGATYHIAVDNTAAVQYGVKSVAVDGKPIEGSLLPLAPEGAVVEVQVTMG